MTRTQIDPSLSSGLTTFASPLNILDNGGMEIWQRGSTFTNAVSGSYSADRWKQAGNATAHVISQDSSFVDSGQYSFKWNITSTTGASVYQQETVENYQAYLGKTVTLSMRIKASAPIQIWITDGITATYSASHPGDNAFHTLSITVTLSSSGTAFGAAFGFSTISTSVGTYYIDSAMLVLGSTAANFVPMNPQTDLARCQRFYFQINSTTDSNISMMQCTSTTAAQGRSYYPFQMRTTPTTTVTNGTQAELITATGGGIGLSTLTPSAATRGCQWNATVSSSLVAGNASALVITGGGFVVEFSADL